MGTLFILATIIIILFIITILKLLFKIKILTEKNKYVDEANMWHKLAVTDDLTGVYNRNAYNLYLNEKLKGTKSEYTGIIIFDIDNFKIINDTKGHLAGDMVLKKVAKHLTAVFPEPHHKVFRIGGDEFSVLTKGLSEREMIRHLLVLNKRLDMDGGINLSKGYSLIGSNPEESFQYADEMLYADKLSKKVRDASVESL